MIGSRTQWPRWRPTGTVPWKEPIEFPEGRQPTSRQFFVAIGARLLVAAVLWWTVALTWFSVWTIFAAALAVLSTLLAVAMCLAWVAATRQRSGAL